MGNLLCGRGGGPCRKIRRRSSSKREKIPVRIFSPDPDEDRSFSARPVLKGPDDDNDNDDEDDFKDIIPDESSSSTSSSSGSKCDPLKMNALYEEYASGDDSDDVISAGGVERLCADLELRPEEFRVLVLAWKCSAERMCRFSRFEFVSGCKALRADDLRGLRTRLTGVADDLVYPESVLSSGRNSPINASKFDVISDALKDDSLIPSDGAKFVCSARFRDLYRFAYDFGLESGQRILRIDMAASLWRLLFGGFSDSQPAIADAVERWSGFLESRSGARGVSRDTWNMFLNFLETVGSNLGAYDDEEAWPSLLDDFVEFEKGE